MPVLPPEPLVPPRAALRGLVAMIVGAALLCAAAVALPHDRYIRYQQFANGDMSRLRWVYERIHFDPTPIDVAIVGSSRTEAAVSAPALEAGLSADLGRPIHVANLSVPLEGRDMHFAVAQELLRARPETRLVLMSLVAPIRRSHPAFRNVGDVDAVLGAPKWINYYWLDNVSFLPYRQLSLFAQSLAPALFGVRREFAPALYRGTAFDTTRSFRLENGKLVNRDVQPGAAKLDAEPGQGTYHRSLVERLTGGDANVIEMTLSRALARQMAARCTALLFVNLPVWKGRIEDIDVAANRRFAPVLVAPATVGDQAEDYTDAEHLGTRGIAGVSRWLPGALRPYERVLARPPACPAA